MKKCQSIIADIFDSLGEIPCSISYHPKTGAGRSATCSFFTLSFFSDWDWNLVQDPITKICKKWNLELDESDEGDIDLNAFWDVNSFLSSGDITK